MMSENSSRFVFLKAKKKSLKMIILTKNHYYTILNDREEPSYKLQIHLKPPKCQLKVKAGERMVQ